MDSRGQRPAWRMTLTMLLPYLPSKENLSNSPFLLLLQILSSSLPLRPPRFTSLTVSAAQHGILFLQPVLAVLDNPPLIHSLLLTPFPMYVTRRQTPDHSQDPHQLLTTHVLSTTLRPYPALNPQTNQSHVPSYSASERVQNRTTGQTGVAPRRRRHLPAVQVQAKLSLPPQQDG